MAKSKVGMRKMSGMPKAGMPKKPMGKPAKPKGFACGGPVKMASGGKVPKNCI